MAQPAVSLSLKRNFSWTMMGNLVYAGSQWGILVVFTKLGRPEMVGQFTLGLAVTAPIFMLTNLQLRQIQATDAKQLYQFRDYLGLRLLSGQLAVLAVVPIALFSGYRWQTMVVVMLLGFAKCLESISDVCYGFLQKHERMDRIALSLMMRGPLALLFLGLGVWSSGSAIGGVLGLILAWGIVLIGYDLANALRLLEAEGPNSPRRWMELGRLKPNWNIKRLFPLVKLALPLGLVMMLSSLSSNLPNYFTIASLGERELGIFNAIAYLMVAGNIIVGALGDSASPRLAKHYASGDRAAYSLLLFRLVGIGFVLGAAAVAIAALGGGTLLSLLYSPDYGERKPLFIALMVASGMQYMASFLGYGLTAARYFKTQVPLLSISAVSLAIACYCLIPSKGLMGAAFALILAAGVQFCMSLGAIVHAISTQRAHAEAS
ncbi:lipopolysaccharide biosynthesis protein [Altericista sp. CCNU0014]|uniref:lipopolysaccharide biosynthesis protein n=1 Tax=Altericista sp. CCNU0014 TaxID=3082949 RepID=UPI00384B8B1C